MRCLLALEEAIFHRVECVPFGHPFDFPTYLFVI